MVPGDHVQGGSGGQLLYPPAKRQALGSGGESFQSRLQRSSSIRGPTPRTPGTPLLNKLAIDAGEGRWPTFEKKTSLTVTMLHSESIRLYDTDLRPESYRLPSSPMTAEREKPDENNFSPGGGRRPSGLSIAIPPDGPSGPPAPLGNFKIQVHKVRTLVQGITQSSQSQV
jgi:hypothetical protein